jgi:S1-C subfamily serine protease
MSLRDLFASSRSGVVHINFVRGGDRIASGSGFLVARHLVTNNHVFRGPEDCDVLIRFSDSDPNNFNDGVRMPYRDFATRLVAGSDENNFDFAVLNVPEILAQSGHNFAFGDPSSIAIGDSVAFLGYPLEHLNLVCHAGIVSSIYTSAAVRVFQLDASVNHSNSGGPLVDPSSGRVVGIITRKATGLSRMFQDLIASFEQNAQICERARGIALGGVDPMAALAASQRQMQMIAREIERSANVGIGYAFSIEDVAGEGVFRT